MKLEIGEVKPHRPGAPDWENVWPVLMDGVEFAEIEETENGYRARSGGWVGRERPFRPNARVVLAEFNQHKSRKREKNG